MKNFLFAALQILATVAVAAIICVSAVFVAKAVGEPVTEKDDVKRCIEEIAEWCELEDFGYTVQEIRFFGEDYDEGARYYLIVVYADSDEDNELHRYEFACEIEGNDVDCDLVRDDICEEY